MTTTEYQIVKAWSGRGWYINRWTSYGWERAVTTLFRTKTAAEKCIEEWSES